MIMMWRNGYDDTTGTPHGQAGANTSEGGMRSLQSTAGSRSSTREMLAGVHGENDRTYGAAHTGRTAARGWRRPDQWRGAWQRWAEAQWRVRLRRYGTHRLWPWLGVFRELEHDEAAKVKLLDVFRARAILQDGWIDGLLVAHVDEIAVGRRRDRYAAHARDQSLAL